MGSKRFPKGVVARSIPDWKTGQLHALNNAGTGGGLGTNNGAGLFNDARDGSMLVVWHLEASIRAVASPSTQQLFTLGFLNGNAGAITTQGQPLDTSQPWLGGSCFAIPGGASLTTNDFMDLSVLTGYWTWPHDYPICVVRPGQSLICNAFGPVQDWDVNFLWEVTKAL